MDEFQQQLIQHAPELLRFSVALTCDFQRGESLLVDSLQRAIEKRKFWNAKKNIKIWLLQIIHNLEADRIRQQTTKTSSKLNLPPIAGMEPVLNAKLQRGLTTMGFEQRSVLLLTVLEKLNYKDIVAITGAPIQIVMTQLHDARRQLRQVIGAHSFQTGGKK